MQRFHRNQKWWWALWLWGFEVCIVNAYCMMKRYCKLKGVNPPYTHYGFREKFGKALLDPVKEWPRWGGLKSPPENKKRKSPPSTKLRAPRMTDKTLSPTKGKLNGRLNPDLGHFPVPPAPGKSNKDSVCQLHRMANRKVKNSNEIPKGGRLNVFLCKGCNVLLCVKCWEKYHTVRHLEDEYCGILSG